MDLLLQIKFQQKPSHQESSQDTKVCLTAKPRDVTVCFTGICNIVHSNRCQQVQFLELCAYFPNGPTFLLSYLPIL